MKKVEWLETDMYSKTNLNAENKKYEKQIMFSEHTLYIAQDIWQTGIH